MGSRSRNRVRLGLAWAAALSLLAAGCASGQGPNGGTGGAEDEAFFEDALVGPQVPDPIEPVNRKVFAANMTLDSYVVDPIARAYGAVTPAPIKTAVRSVFANLNAPVVFVNQVLQLDPKRAAQTLGRFVLNTTLGVGGILDPAAELGWIDRRADFGQTLGRYGVGPGCYLVLPLLGPSTARDAVGTAVDLFLRVDTWFLPFQSQILLGGGFGISERESRREEMRVLRESSIDFYAAVRSAYLQTRAALVRDARERRD